MNKNNYKNWLNNKNMSGTIEINGKQVNASEFMDPKDESIAGFTESLKKHFKMIDDIETEIKKIKKTEDTLIDFATSKKGEMQLYKDLTNEFDKFSADMLRSVEIDSIKGVLDELKLGPISKKLDSKDAIDEELSKEILASFLK